MAFAILSLLDFEWPGRISRIRLSDKTSRLHLLIGVGSRRRSASQAIDLPSNGGVNLGRLVTIRFARVCCAQIAKLPHSSSRRRNVGVVKSDHHLMRAGAAVRTSNENRRFIGANGMRSFVDLGPVGHLVSVCQRVDRASLAAPCHRSPQSMRSLAPKNSWRASVSAGLAGALSLSPVGGLRAVGRISSVLFPEQPCSPIRRLSNAARTISS
jgi:hypothetical protein